MKREVAIKIATGLRTDFKCESDTMVDFCSTIIKALEQEPVLDKIKTEINKLPDLNPDYEMDKTIHVSKWAVFDIIDKYKESEE